MSLCTQMEVTSWKEVSGNGSCVASAKATVSRWRAIRS